MPPFADRKFKIKARAGPGRPPVQIDHYFAEIQPFLRLGMTLSKASLCAGIPKRTVYEHYNADSVFPHKMRCGDDGAESARPQHSAGGDQGR